MNSQYFVYRRGDVVTEPNSKNLETLTSNMAKVVVAMAGKYNSMVSGLNLGRREIMSYHEDDFRPQEALMSNNICVPVREVRKIEKHHTYETVVSPNSEIAGLGVIDTVESGEIVFQVGVREHKTNVITVGIVENTNKYINEEDITDSQIKDNSESGSGVFSRDGKLIGMTLGILSPQVMIAVSIIYVIMKDKPIFSPSLTWRLGQKKNL